MANNGRGRSHTQQICASPEHYSVPPAKYANMLPLKPNPSKAYGVRKVRRLMLANIVHTDHVIKPNKLGDLFHVTYK